MFLYELTSKQKETFICLAYVVVVADGDLSPDEQSMMDELRREIALPESFEPHYIALEGIDEIFNDRRARVATLIALIRLGYADGKFEIEEQLVVKEVCALFGVSEEEFARIENWVRRLISLQKEAHSFL